MNQKVLPPSHPLATTLLEHHSHVLPDHIPPGLPAKRAIQHHIDLILETILTNKPAYRMKPKETMEIQRQGDELIITGLVRVSLTSCVAQLLAPKKDVSMKCVWIAKPSTRL